MVPSLLHARRVSCPCPPFGDRFFSACSRRILMAVFCSIAQELRTQIAALKDAKEQLEARIEQLKYCA